MLSNHYLLIFPGGTQHLCFKPFLTHVTPFKLGGTYCLDFKQLLAPIIFLNKKKTVFYPYFCEYFHFLSEFVNLGLEFCQHLEEKWICYLINRRGKWWMLRILTYHAQFNFAILIFPGSFFRLTR